MSTTEQPRSTNNSEAPASGRAERTQGQMGTDEIRDTRATTSMAVTYHSGKAEVVGQAADEDAILDRPAKSVQTFKAALASESVRSGLSVVLGLTPVTFEHSVREQDPKNLAVFTFRDDASDASVTTFVSLSYSPSPKRNVVRCKVSDDRGSALTNKQKAAVRNLLRQKAIECGVTFIEPK